MKYFGPTLLGQTVFTQLTLKKREGRIRYQRLKEKAESELKLDPRINIWDRYGYIILGLFSITLCILAVSTGADDEGSMAIGGLGFGILFLLLIQLIGYMY